MKKEGKEEKRRYAKDIFIVTLNKSIEIYAKAKWKIYILTLIAIRIYRQGD